MTSKRISRKFCTLPQKYPLISYSLLYSLLYSSCDFEFLNLSTNIEGKRDKNLRNRNDFGNTPFRRTAGRSTTEPPKSSSTSSHFADTAENIWGRLLAGLENNEMWEQGSPDVSPNRTWIRRRLRLLSQHNLGEISSRLILRSIRCYRGLNH